MMKIWKPRYFDIGVNLSDAMFQGNYHGSAVKKHPADLDKVIERAHLFNVDRMLITASTISESKDHIGLCARYQGKLFATAGVHPCSVAQEFYTHEGEHKYSDELLPNVDAKLAELKSIVEEGVQVGAIKSFGEIGLDYDRLHYSSKTQQLTMFHKQLQLVAELKHLKLPLFLHMRNACEDFCSVLKPFIDNGSVFGGVVHSFTGTKEELSQLLGLGFYIGINGCSLKTEENLAVAALIPKERLMIETDAPWCEVRKSHTGYKYITEYPNKFYPEVKSSAEPEPEREVPEETQKPQKGKKNQKKEEPIKLDPFLPFPSIKLDHFVKHTTAVNKLLENHKTPETIDYRIGQFAYPLMKSRNEPVYVGYVAEIMARLYDITEEKDLEEFLDLVYLNTCKVFHAEEQIK